MLERPHSEFKLRDIRCLIGLHKWVRGRDEEGAKMLVCRRCGKQDHEPNTGMIAGS